MIPKDNSSAILIRSEAIAAAAPACLHRMCNAPSPCTRLPCHHFYSPTPSSVDHVTVERSSSRILHPFGRLDHVPHPHRRPATLLRQWIAPRHPAFGGIDWTEIMLLHLPLQRHKSLPHALTPPRRPPPAGQGQRVLPVRSQRPNAPSTSSLVHGRVASPAGHAARRVGKIAPAAPAFVAVLAHELDRPCHRRACRLETSPVGASGLEPEK